MIIRLDKNDSKIVKDNKTYTLLDNTKLNNLVVSKTILHPHKNTRGHSHKGQEEIYHFISGEGYMILGDEQINVEAGSIILIPDGIFHQVWNTSSLEDLVFVCVFDGKRNH